jgi:hypothetical protein
MSSSEVKILTVELTDSQGRPVTVQLDETQARHLLAQAIRAFGWDLRDDPLAEGFMKSLLAGLDFAEKIEGGA